MIDIDRVVNNLLQKLCISYELIVFAKKENGYLKWLFTLLRKRKSSTTYFANNIFQDREMSLRTPSRKYF